MNPKAIRKSLLHMANRAQSPHIGSALSCVEMLLALYELAFLPIPSSHQDFGLRDRILLSKAHSAMSLYAILHHLGAMSEEMILGYYQHSLPAHTDRQSSPYIEISAGSLGHGLPIGLGMALGLVGVQNPDNRQARVFVLMGDGEIQEGSVWEAAMLAPKLQLSHLVVLIDRNDLQGYGRASELVCFEPLEQKWRAFGWDCERVNGHDKEAIKEAINAHFLSCSPKPLCLVCDTIKGKGVSFMEDELKWHYFLVTQEILQKALEELQ